MKLTASTAIAAVLLLGACAATTEASAPDQPVETADASAGDLGFVLGGIDGEVDGDQDVDDEGDEEREDGNQ